MCRTSRKHAVSANLIWTNLGSWGKLVIVWINRTKFICCLESLWDVLKTCLYIWQSKAENTQFLGSQYPFWGEGRDRIKSAEAESQCLQILKQQTFRWGEGQFSDSVTQGEVVYQSLQHLSLLDSNSELIFLRTLSWSNLMYLESFKFLLGLPLPFGV